ncbi:MAG: hypothetical protein EOM23_02285 [Candidatus Moranbacteria bacterium]|nr:hypothetical protein [Candidatus Moranbacteria bacterium]
MRRIKAWKIFNQVDELPDTFHLLPMPLIIDNSENNIEFIEYINSYKICNSLIIFDTFKKCTSNDNNKNYDTTIFLNSIYDIIKFTYSQIMIVHYSGKNKERGMLGETALIGALDAVFKIEKLRKFYAKMVCEKIRDVDSPDDIDFKMNVVDTMRKDVNMLDVTSLVPEKINKKLVRNARAICSRSESDDNDEEW